MIAAALSDDDRKKWVAALDKEARAQRVQLEASNAVTNAAAAKAALRTAIDTTYDCAGAEIDAETGTIIPVAPSS